jgi:hypothetical protein
MSIIPSLKMSSAVTSTAPSRWLLSAAAATIGVLKATFETKPGDVTYIGEDQFKKTAMLAGGVIGVFVKTSRAVILTEEPTKIFKFI